MCRQLILCNCQDTKTFKVSLATLPSHKNNSWTCLTLSLDWVREKIAPQPGSSIPEKRKHEFDELTYPSFRPTFSQQSKQAAQQPLSLLAGAVISRGHISVAINTLNQSPTLSVWEENLAKLMKESDLLIRILTVCQFKHAGSDKQQKMKSRVFTSVFQILNFRRTISTYFQDVLFYSN